LFDVIEVVVPKVTRGKTITSFQLLYRSVGHKLHQVVLMILIVYRFTVIVILCFFLQALCPLFC